MVLGLTCRRWWWRGLALTERITRVSCRTDAARRVVNHIAYGAIATGAGARIPTLLIDARLAAGTLSVNSALRSAIGRSSQIANQAGTSGSIALCAALGVGAAWRGNTGIDWSLLDGRRWDSFGDDGTVNIWRNHTKMQPLTRHGEAAQKGVARITGATCTNGTVVDHPTGGLFSAGIWTGVDALLANTCLVKRTLRGDGAFGPTRWWGTHILGKTGAHGLFVTFTALRVGTARGWLAGIHILLDGYKMRQSTVFKEFSL